MVAHSVKKQNMLGGVWSIPRPSFQDDAVDVFRACGVLALGGGALHNLTFAIFAPGIARPVEHIIQMRRNSHGTMAPAWRSSLHGVCHGPLVVPTGCHALCLP